MQDSEYGFVGDRACDRDRECGGVSDSVKGEDVVGGIGGQAKDVADVADRREIFQGGKWGKLPPSCLHPSFHHHPMMQLVWIYH